MKRMKKILAVLLAAIMVMSLGTSVFAEESDTTTDNDTTATTYSITIKGVASSNHTFSAYQIFAGDWDNTSKVLSNVKWGSSVSSNASSLVGALKSSTTVIVEASSDDTSTTDEETSTTDSETSSTNVTLGSIFSDISYSAENPNASAAAIAAALSTFNSGNYTDAQKKALAQAFADEVATVSNDSYSYLGDAVKTATSGELVTGSDGVNTYTYKIEELSSAGYYLVTDKLTSSETTNSDEVISDYILQVVDDVEVAVKSSVPTVEKKVTSTNGTSLVDATSASAGETVSFTLTATMPSTYSDYDTYALTFHDTLSTNLTYDTNSLKVTVNTYVPQTSLNSFADGTTYYTLSEGTYTKVTNTSGTPDSSTTYYVYTTTTVTSTEGEYTLVTDSTSITNECNLEVKIGNTNELKDSSNNYISVNESTTIVVTYTATVSDNISATSTAESNSVELEYSNNPNDNSETGTTTEDKVYVYTYDLNVYKENGDGKALSGAKFTLYKAVSVTAEEFAPSSTTYYTYSENATAMTTVESDASFDSSTTYYVKVNATENATSEDDNGKQVATFNDLGEGTYVLEETTTPSGYNTAALVKFTISATYADDGSSVSTLGTDNESVTAVDSSKSTLTTTVKNSSGSKIPSTGGIGTTIFYVVGAVLVLGAAVILITRRRMGNRA